MKHPTHLHTRSLLLACCLAAVFPAAHAADAPAATTTTTETTSPTTTTAIGTSANTEAKLSAEFAEFLGGETQAQSVVSGLRQGTAFDLVTEATATDTTGATTTATTTTIDPPTDTMGYGNVRITLRLAQAQLSQMGITQPTAEELSAILLGGDINGTQVNGILALRAEGMGWGQIAKEYGTTVGQIMGNGAAKPTTAASTASQAKTTGKGGYVSAATTKSGQASQARSNGYIPSSAKPASAPRANGYIPSGNGKANGAIVTAAGGSAGGSAFASGKAQVHKTVSSSAQGAGMVSAGGRSNALAPGQAKKH